jgi:4-amino-4-deoxy-L-arabinose transferase-like glycosyltransferase
LARAKLWAVLPVLLLAAGLRLPLLAADLRLHPDEALYARYGRLMSRQGDYLLAAYPLDKPPLGLMLTAWAMYPFDSGHAAGYRQAEFGGRAATVAVSLLAVATTFALGWRWLGARAGLLAALGLALCPFDVAFAATLFHDPLLGLWLLLCALSLCAWRSGWAGLFAALAVATKQSAIQFLPIYMAAALAYCAETAGWRALGRKHLRHFGQTLLLGLAALALWSHARAAPVDYWTLGVSNPGALRFIRADEWLPRLQVWGQFYAEGLAGLPLLPILLVAARPRQLPLALASAGLLGTLLLYWLLAFPLYDRYLHPLMPISVLLMAAGVTRLKGVLGQVAPLTLVIALAAGAANTVTATKLGLANFGADRGVHQGIEALAARLNRLPARALVYDFWLGWELGFYLGHQPSLQLVFVPTPEALARAICQTEQTVYFVAPSGKAVRWLATGRQAGIWFGLWQAGRFELYAARCPRSKRMMAKMASPKITAAAANSSQTTLACWPPNG